MSAASLDIEQWLCDNGLEAYCDRFRGNQVTSDMLVLLNDLELRELGLSVGDRLRFRQAVKEFAESSDHLHLGAAERGSRRFTGERKLVSVLFCDIVSSTELARLLDPEELSKMLRGFHSLMAALAHRFGGVLSERLGDGVSCVFGWPRAHEDDPERAVHAALAMAEEVRKIGVPSLPNWKLEVRATVATGHVVLSGVGLDGTPDVVGKVLHLAERLKGVCPVSGVVIDDATRALVGSGFEFKEVRTGPLRGFDETIRVFEVVAPAEGVSRFERAHGAGLSRIVGREGDFALLSARWALASEGSGQVVLITGQAGIGKSLLAAALGRHVRTRGGRQQLYQCSSISKNTSFYPLISHIVRAAGIRRAEPPDVSRVKLRRFLGADEPASEDAVEIFCDLLSIPGEPGSSFAGATRAPDEWRQKVFEVCLAQVSSAARTGPLMITLEDAHWIDPSSLELLLALAEQSQPASLFVLVTSRDSDLAERWSGLPNFTHLKLNPLSPSQSRELCRDVLGARSSQEPLVEEIVAAAGGVPLFIEALAAMRKYDRDDQRRSGESSGGQLTEPSVPDQLFGFLAERLDRLSGGASTRLVAQAAAAIGREFTLAMLTPLPTLRHLKDIASRVEELVQADIFVRHTVQGTTTLDFSHALYRDVAYQRLLRTTRQTLHDEIALLIEEACPDMVELEPEIVAHHYTLANKRHEAIRHWKNAGDRAINQSATLEALNHYSSGLSLAAQFESSDAQELELSLRVGFGAAASAIQGYSARTIEQNYDRMLKLAEKLDRHEAKFRAHLGLGAFYEVGGQLEQAQHHGNACLQIADQLGNLHQRLHANRLMGEIEFYRGEFACSRRHLEESLALYSDADHARLTTELGDDPGVLSLMYRALSLWYLGCPDQARESCRRGLELARRLGHEFTLAQADFYAAWLHSFLREPERAREHADRSIARCREKGFALVEGQSQVIRGWALSMLGQHADGAREIDLGMERVRGPHADVCESCFLTLQAEHSLWVGDIERGLALLGESEAGAARTCERFADAERLRLRGELLARQRQRSRRSADDADPTEVFERAIARAEEQGSPAMKLRALLGFCRAADDPARRAEAVRSLAALCEVLEEGRETREQREAREYLALQNA